MAKKISLLQALSQFKRAVGQTKKTRTASGRKKRASKAGGKKAAKGRKPIPSRNKGKAKPKKKGRTRSKATPFLKKVTAKDRKRIAKRGVLKLSSKQRKEFLRLKRMVKSRRKLSVKERTTYERLAKQVLNNKIAAADKASINKKNSRKARSKTNGRRTTLKNSRKTTVARGARKGRIRKKKSR
jgi:hypothetical protein